MKITRATQIRFNFFKNLLGLQTKVVYEQVFIVNSDSKLELRPFTLIDRKGDMVWMQLDVAANEKIVTSDPRVLKEGVRVETKNTQSKAPVLKQMPAAKE